MNETAWLGMVITGLIYSGIFIGLWLTFRRSMSLLYRGLQVRHRLNADKKSPLAMSPWGRHLYYLLGATLKQPCRPELFLAICIALLCFLTALSLRSFHPMTALGIGIAGMCMPYLLLRIRLETRRRRGSLEGEKLISELLRQYRICGGNIYEALERVIPLIRDCKVCCSLLYRMLLRLRNTGNDLEIQEATGMFSFGVGTNWSCMLSSCIRMGATRGCNVSLGLEDILLQMRQAKGRMEERKRLNSEAMRLTLFMVPLLYLATVWLSIYYLEVPPLKFIKNQVGTPEGMLMLLLIAFLFLLNLAVIEMINNQKLDY